MSNSVRPETWKVQHLDRVSDQELEWCEFKGTDAHAKALRKFKHWINKYGDGHHLKMLKIPEGSWEQ